MLGWPHTPSSSVSSSNSPPLSVDSVPLSSSTSPASPTLPAPSSESCIAPVSREDIRALLGCSRFRSCKTRSNSCLRSSSFSPKSSSSESLARLCCSPFSPQALTTKPSVTLPSDNATAPFSGASLSSALWFSTRALTAHLSSFSLASPLAAGSTTTCSRNQASRSSCPSLAFLAAASSIPDISIFPVPSLLLHCSGRSLTSCRTKSSIVGRARWCERGTGTLGGKKVGAATLPTLPPPNSSFSPERTWSGVVAFTAIAFNAAAPGSNGGATRARSFSRIFSSTAAGIPGRLRAMPPPSSICREKSATAPAPSPAWPALAKTGPAAPSTPPFLRSGSAVAGRFTSPRPLCLAPLAKSLLKSRGGPPGRAAAYSRFPSTA